MTYGVIFLWLGLFGLLGMTFLFPVISLFLRPFFKKTKLPPLSLKKLEVLIPAHNEEKSIANTLQSILRAAHAVRKFYPEFELKIRVGADSCTDRTSEIASASGATEVESFAYKSKWKVICALLGKVEKNSWCALVDSGAIWPEELILYARGRAEEPGVFGIAPSYRIQNTGRLSQVFWQFEKILKSLESLSIGPISVHGASVIYRSELLQKAMRELSNLVWLNDDVVIPLWLKASNPEGKIIYLAGVSVMDAGVAAVGRSGNFNRRKRIVFGNLQWTTRLWPRVLFKNFEAAIGALRRIFRVFWAYWLTFFILGLIGIFLNPPATVVATCGVIALAAIFEPFMASLLAPYYLVTNASSASKISWT